METNKMLTSGEIAKICDVTVRTVQRWIDRGLLHSYKLPGRGDNRVKTEDFIHFLKTQNLPIPVEFREKTRRILIVDDEVNMAKSIQRALIQANFETAIAENGFIAGSMIEHFSPSLVTLDLRMPGMDGFGVIRFIRASARLTSIKILVISGLSDEDLKKAVESGADEAIKKPFSNSDLITTVERLLRGGSHDQ